MFPLALVAEALGWAVVDAGAPTTAALVTVAVLLILWRKVFRAGRAVRDKRHFARQP